MESNKDMENKSNKVALSTKDSGTKTNATEKGNSSSAKNKYTKVCSTKA